MVAESSVPIFSQVLSAITFPESASAEARASGVTTAHFSRRPPLASAAVTRKRRRSIEVGAAFADPAFARSITSSAFIAITFDSLSARSVRFFIPGRPRRFQSIPSGAKQTRRAITVARFSLALDSRPSAPARFPYEESSLAGSDCHSSRGLSACGTVLRCSGRARPWAFSATAVANRLRQAGHAGFCYFPFGGTQNNAGMESPFRRLLVSRSWGADDCRRPAADRRRAHGS